MQAISNRSMRLPLAALALGALGLSLAGMPQDSSMDSSCAGGSTKKGSYASRWQALYPSSQSLNHVTAGTGTSCQLCHRDGGGDEPYNGYGWAQRQLIRSGSSLESALAQLNSVDSDADPVGFSNLDEIASGVQPGWTDGPSNTIYFHNGSQQTGQLPPGAIVGPTDPKKFATTVQNGTGVNPLILSDNGGGPTASPEIGSLLEPFGVALDCSAAAAPGIYILLIQASLSAVPVSSRFGELLCSGPTFAKFVKPHNQDTRAVGPIKLPYDLNLVGLSYCVQGFCSDPAARAFVSNALSQTIGI